MPKISSEAELAQYLAKLDHTLLDVIHALRQTISAADPVIAEHIKWNSPAFYYAGEMAPFDPKEYKRDIVVFHGY